MAKNNQQLNRRVRTAIHIDGVMMTPARQTEVHSHLMIELIRSVPDLDPKDVTITFTNGDMR